MYLNFSVNLPITSLWKSCTIGYVRLSPLKNRLLMERGGSEGSESEHFSWQPCDPQASSHVQQVWRWWLSIVTPSPPSRLWQPLTSMDGLPSPQTHSFFAKEEALISGWAYNLDHYWYSYSDMGIKINMMGMETPMGRLSQSSYTWNKSLAVLDICPSFTLSIPCSYG